jgi:hypothetical protein
MYYIKAECHQVAHNTFKVTTALVTHGENLLWEISGDHKHCSNKKEKENIKEKNSEKN